MIISGENEELEILGKMGTRTDPDPSKSTFVMVIGKQCQRFMACCRMSLRN